MAAALVSVAFVAAHHSYGLETRLLGGTDRGDIAGRRVDRYAMMVATLWGKPHLGQAKVRLADGIRIGWQRGKWSLSADRQVRLDLRAV